MFNLTETLDVGLSKLKSLPIWYYVDETCPIYPNINIISFFKFFLF